MKPTQEQRMTTKDATISAPGLWLDFRYYVLWWMFWTTLFSLLQPVVEEGPNLWTVRALQFGVGLAYGAVLGAAFTVAQNSVNKARRKPVSWALALAVAILGKLASIAVFGL
jgi:hypothetical protein